MRPKPFRSPTPALLLTASLLLAACVPLATAPRAHAQGITTGVITGRAEDTSGAVVPNVRITALNNNTGVQLKTTSDQKGEFNFRNVPSGKYTVSVEGAGFEANKVENVSVTAGQDTNLEAIRLGVGSASTSVEVSTAVAPLLQTTDSQVSTTFDSRQTQDLPLNGGLNGGLDNIALLQPGVAIGHDAAFSNANGNNLSINGQRSRSNNYEIDGQSNNDNSVAGPQIFFNNQDAVDSIQVITSNFNAAYGRNMGGVINYLTKAGTNRFHGSGYEFYTGNFLQSATNAERLANLTRLPRYVDNRYGGTIGGPVWRDKVWFFGGTNFEHRREGFTPFNVANPAPTANGIQQLQAAFPGNAAVAAYAAAGPQAVLQFTPQGPLLTRRVTGPNGVTVPVEFTKFSTSVAPLYNDQEDLGRVDWQPNGNDHFFLRYIYQNNATIGLQQGNGYYYNIPGITHSMGGDWTHTFSPHWVNQVRYSFQQSKLFFQGGTQANCVAITLDQCNASFTISGIAGFGYNTNIPQGRTVKVTQVQDNATWTIGTHSISFGGDFTYQNSPNTFLPAYNGGYTFSNFSNFVQGTGTLNLGNGNPVIPFTERDFGLYIQDDWKVLASLTLNLGFRYEFYGQAVNLLNSETVARETGPNPFWNTSLPLAQRVYPYTQPNYKNLQPRLGFAWNPQQLRKLVVRGAYGIQYDPAFYNVFLNSATAAPVINLGSITCGGTGPNCLPNGVNGAAVRAANLAQIPTGVDPSYRSQTTNTSTFVNPRAQTYSLGVQYGLGGAVLGISYIGNHVSRQFQSVNANPYLAPVAEAFPNLVSPSSLCQDMTKPLGLGRLNCNSGNVTTRNNNAFSNYNSLQTQVQTRAYRGATLNASYTYSRVIDNVDEVYGASNSSGSLTSLPFAQNPLATDIPERGVANYSYPNLASIGLNYDVPSLIPKSSLLGRALGGFEFAANWNFNNGESYTPYQYYAATTFTDPAGVVTPNNTSYCDRKFNQRYGYDTCRPILANAAAPVQSVGVYVNDPALTFTTAGTGFYNYTSTDANGKLNAPVNKSDVHWLYNNQAYANLVGNPYPGAARNIVRGQSYNNVDAAIIKTTDIREGIGIKLYLNAFNVLNRQFLGTPDPFIEDPTFGGFAANTGTQRSVQLGGKVVF